MAITYPNGHLIQSMSLRSKTSLRDPKWNLKKVSSWNIKFLEQSKSSKIFLQIASEILNLLFGKLSNAKNSTMITITSLRLWEASGKIISQSMWKHTKAALMDLINSKPLLQKIRLSLTATNTGLKTGSKIKVKTLNLELDSFSEKTLSELKNHISFTI